MSVLHAGAVKFAERVGVPATLYVAIAVQAAPVPHKFGIEKFVAAVDAGRVTLPPQLVVIVTVPEAGAQALVMVPLSVYVPPVQAEGVAVMVLHCGALYAAGMMLALG